MKARSMKLIFALLLASVSSIAVSAQAQAASLALKVHSAFSMRQRILPRLLPKLSFVTGSKACSGGFSTGLT